MAKKRFKIILFALIILTGLFFAWKAKDIFKKLIPGKPKQAQGQQAKEAKTPEGRPVPKEGAPAQKQQEQIVPVRIAPVSLKDFIDTMPAIGTVKPYSKVELKFEVNGVVGRINFQDGDMVKKADVLMNLDQRDAVLKVDYAKSKLKTAQSQSDTSKKKMEMMEDLYKIGAIIRNKLEEATLEHQTSKAQVESAEKEVLFAEVEFKKTILLAPMDGVMGARQVEIGSYVTPNNKVADIMDIKQVYIELGIIEKDISKISLGQKVEVTVDAAPGTTLSGTIDNLSPMIEGKTRTLTARVKIDNSRFVLLPGMFVRAQVVVFSKENAMMVPSAALHDTNGDGKFDTVYAVNKEEKKAEVRPVKIGYMTSDYVQILEGLSEGDNIVTEAQGPLKDGSNVEILEEELAAPEEGAQEEGLPQIPGKPPKE